MLQYRVVKTIINNSYHKLILLGSIVLVAVFSFSCVTCSAIATSPDFFTTRLTIDLCPEYKLGNATLVIKYTIGENPTVYKTNILKQVVNSAKTSGTFDIELPATFGATPLHVFAYCYNRTQRQGEPSKQIEISNCSRLMEVDQDKDGLKDGIEDLDCSNEFSPGDYSNLHNVDTDGDGMRDLVEFVSNTDPANPGSSPRPLIFQPGPFDPDNNKESNPVIWRGSSGEWFIKDYKTAGQTLFFQFGASGDIPITYKPESRVSDVGVIRTIGGSYYWYFHGPGFRKANGERLRSIKLGYWGDNVAIGPWEKSGASNPAVIRYYNGVWEWDVFYSSGKIRRKVFGGPNDVPKFADYDGDGIFDIGVYRFADRKLYVVFSSDGSTHSYSFGTLTAENYYRGDVTGDGKDDITFWESKTTLFTTLTSDSGFDDLLVQTHDPIAYQEEQLGTYGETIPLSSFKIGNRIVYTVVDHNTGYRYYRMDNRQNAKLRKIQWGLPGDSQG